MGALAGNTLRPVHTIRALLMPLATQHVYAGGMACADTSANQVKKGASGNANLIRIGTFDAETDNSAGTGTVLVNVTLEQEIWATWYDNATGSNKITIANFFADAYILDDHTVTSASSGNSKAGRVWAVDAIKGVLISCRPDGAAL